MTTTITAPAYVTNLGFDDWWLPCGVSPEDCAAAYAAAGAASYADSKVNLANPGTYDCVDTGHAPDWDNVNGWKFDGVSEYLDTGISNNPYLNNHTMIVKFSNFIIAVDYAFICGWCDNGQYFAIGSYNNAGGTDQDYYGYGFSEGALIVSREPYTQSGVRAIVSQTAGYLNGNIDIDTADIGYLSSTPVYILLGCFDYAGDSPSLFSNIYIQSFCFYSKRLTQTQIQDIGNAMP